MNVRKMLACVAATSVVAVSAGCVTWNEMDRSEKGTAVGATGGALAGAAIGGPIGAVVGAGAGAYIGHHQADDRETRRVDDRHARSDAAMDDRGDPVVRSAQQSLNARGFDAGPVDGRLGPATQDAVVRFQQANDLATTGTLDEPTLNALGVNR